MLIDHFGIDARGVPAASAGARRPPCGSLPLRPLVAEDAVVSAARSPARKRRDGSRPICVATSSSGTHRPRPADGDRSLRHDRGRSRGGRICLSRGRARDRRQWRQCLMPSGSEGIIRVRTPGFVANSQAGAERQRRYRRHPGSIPAISDALTDNGLSASPAALRT